MLRITGGERDDADGIFGQKTFYALKVVRLLDFLNGLERTLLI
jgi:hypothetical protein